MSFLGRVFGLKDFVGPINCSCPNVLVLNTSHDWPVYVSPGILLLLHYTVTALPKLHRHRPSHQVPALPACGRPGVLLPPGPWVGVGLTLWLCFCRGRKWPGRMRSRTWNWTSWSGGHRTGKPLR